MDQRSIQPVVASRYSRHLLLALFLAGWPGAGWLGAEESALGITSSVVEYKDGETVLEGYLARNPATLGPRPGILICHAWMGHDTNVRKRADQLARMGYVAFALDIYGKGVRAANAQEAGKLAGSYKADRELLRRRAMAGLAALRSSAGVDVGRIAVIGYCFGGTTALELARCGADIQGVVSFHGGLDAPLPAEKGKVKASLLICHGGADPFVSPEEVKGFQSEMDAAGVDWQLNVYSGAVHSFTERSAGDDPSKGAAYDAAADGRSWVAMQSFFDEIFHEGEATADSDAAATSAPETEPLEPSEAQEDKSKSEASAANPPMPLPEGYFCPFEDPDSAWVWINFEERSIITFARVCSYTDPIELTLCQRGGKSHESIFECFALARNLHAGALLVGADRPRAPLPPDGGPATEAIYDTAKITVEWETKDGEPYEQDGKSVQDFAVTQSRIENFVLVAGTQEAMPHVDWLFIGSYFASVPKDWRNKSDTFEVYAADYFDWGIVTTFNTPGSVFDNPLAGGADDEWYVSNRDLVPPADTVVMIKVAFGEKVKRPIITPPESGHRPEQDTPPEESESESEEK